MRPPKPQGLSKDFVLVSGMPGEVYAGMTGFDSCFRRLFCLLYWRQTGGQEGVRSEYGDQLQS